MLKAITNKIFCILIGFILGFVVSGLICQGETQEVRVSTIDTLIVYEKKDTTVLYDTVYLKGKTVYITPDTPFGDIPLRCDTIKDDLPIVIKYGKTKELVIIPFTERITYRGILYNRTIETRKQEVYLGKMKVKSFGFFGSLGAGYANGGSVPAMAEVGLKYKRLSLSGFVLHIDKWHYGGFFRIWL